GERDRIANTLRLAEQLGGEAVMIPGSDAADELVGYARANNCTHIVIAKSHRSQLSEWLRGSSTHQIIRRAGEISVHVIAGQAVAKAESKPEDAVATPAQEAGVDYKAYAGTIAMVAAALGLGLVLQHFLGIPIIALVFLTAVLVSAITYGLWP